MSKPPKSDLSFSDVPLDDRAVIRLALQGLMEKQPPFALNKMMEEWEDEPEFLTRMLGIFIRDTQIDIDTIALEFAAFDHEKMARTAHRLKGAAAALGADAIREQAALLESMGRKGELKDADACIGKLRTEFERFVDCLSGIPLSQGTT